jgi:hypothetical protein
VIHTILSLALLFLPSGNAIANPDCIPPSSVEICGIEQTGMFDPCAVLSEANIDRQTMIEGTMAWIPEYVDWYANQIDS